MFKKIDHIGMVVENLEEAMNHFSDKLGLEAEARMGLDDIGIRMAFYTFGEGRLELIQFQGPIDGVDPIVTQPKKGVQHVAFQVDDLSKAILALTQKGMRLVKGFPREGAHGPVAFFYPIKGWDLLIEICQPMGLKKGGREGSPNHEAQPAVLERKDRTASTRGDESLAVEASETATPL